jgi:hypothetical protein
MRPSHALLAVAAVLAALAAIDVAREHGVSLRARIQLLVAAIFLAAAVLTG